MQLTALFIAVGINLIVIALIYVQLNRKIHTKDTSERILSDVRREVDEILVELNQTTDRNIGIIEERINRISKAVEEADKRIRLLQKTTDTFTMSTATYSSVRPKVRNLQKEPKEEPRKEDIGIPGASSGKAGVEAEDLDSTYSTESPDEHTAEELPTADKRERVKELHRQGMSLDVIASKINSTVGEVELMITLMEEKLR